MSASNSGGDLTKSLTLMAETIVFFIAFVLMCIVCRIPFPVAGVICLIGWARWGKAFPLRFPQAQPAAPQPPPRPQGRAEPSFASEASPVGETRAERFARLSRMADALRAEIDELQRGDGPVG